VARLVLLRDVTRERSQERANQDLIARIEQMTPDDVLTGLRNRRRFHEEHEREHGRSQRAWDSYAVVRADVDGMAEINDRFGIAAGDRVLQRVAVCLNRCRREYDVLCRFDGDEFAALLPGADVVAARTVGNRFALAVQMHEFEFTEVKVTVSVGAAVWIPSSPHSAEKILELARAATDRARALGPGRVEVDGEEGPPTVGPVGG
jgi:diguanylate cyclase (GGDEF)-like protein